MENHPPQPAMKRQSKGSKQPQGKRLRPSTKLQGVDRTRVQTSQSGTASGPKTQVQNRPMRRSATQVSASQRSQRLGPGNVQVSRGPMGANQPMRWRWLHRWRFVSIVLIVAGLVVIAGNQFLSEPATKQLPTNAPTIASTAKAAPTQNPVTKLPPPPPASPMPAASDAIQAPQTKGNRVVVTSQPVPSPADSPVAIPVIPPPSTAVTRPVDRFGHLPYPEASGNRLRSIGKFVRENYSREEYLDSEVALYFQAMVDAARAQNVQLMGISGFRSVKDQHALFERQIERKGSAQAAAKWSAPPGHSEHHTGYAIDIGDVTRGDADIKVRFETTRAYQWLVTNAAQYGFEQSFPRGNHQGVSYEPWHWRFVGTPKAQQIFAAARS